MAYAFSSFSDKGPYPDNQDSFKVEDADKYFVACIADGVGGASRGGEAARLTTDAFISKVSCGQSNELDEIVKAANSRLLAESPDGGMVTTFSGCVISNQILRGIHAGDTRICILRGNGIKQLTEDHTEYYRFYKEGRLTPEDAANYPRKHILENALGVRPDPRIDSFSFRLESGDRIILTTDGVHGLVSKKTFRDISLAAKNVTQFVADVIKEVQRLGPSDNFSVVAIDIP